jgi:hypothetical protein
MSQLDVTRQQTNSLEPQGATGAHGNGGHGRMMIVCCIPMLVIAVVLVATGVVSVGLIFVALMCTAMMATMMSMMSGGSGTQDQGKRS